MKSELIKNELKDLTKTIKIDILEYAPHYGIKDQAQSQCIKKCIK